MESWSAEAKYVKEGGLWLSKQEHGVVMLTAQGALDIL